MKVNEIMRPEQWIKDLLDELEDIPLWSNDIYDIYDPSFNLVLLSDIEKFIKRWREKLK